MNSIARYFALGAVLFVTSLAFLTLGGVTISRRHSSGDDLGRRVENLWGHPQVQVAPSLALLDTVERDQTETVVVEGRSETRTRRVRESVSTKVTAAQSRIGVDLHLDVRRKGLVYYSLYDVRFEGRYVYRHEGTAPSTLRIGFEFPDPSGVYDDFVFEVDGEARPEARRPSQTGIGVSIPVVPGQVVAFRIGYLSRGRGSYAYRPGTDAVESIRDFELVMRTDFADVDFADEGVSPTSRRPRGRGLELTWRFASVLTGKQFGVIIPDVLQPGDLAAGMAFSAPISVFFFVLVIDLRTRRMRVRPHPMHYALIAGAFFAFHLLFAYTADRLVVESAFALAAVTSVFLVATYTGKLVSWRFALREVVPAQLVYLVGFAFAHFFVGFTGLAVTVLAILTLFLVMQWTAKDERSARTETV